MNEKRHHFFITEGSNIHQYVQKKFKCQLDKKVQPKHKFTRVRFDLSWNSEPWASNGTRTGCLLHVIIIPSFIFMYWLWSNVERNNYFLPGLAKKKNNQNFVLECYYRLTETKLENVWITVNTSQFQPKDFCWISFF